MENAEAEPLESVVTASNSEALSPMPPASIVIPGAHQMANPVRMAVSKTPMVARICPAPAPVLCP